MYAYIILATIAFAVALTLYVAARNIRANIDAAHKICSVTTTAIVKRYDTVMHSKKKDFYPVFEFTDLTDSIHTCRHTDAVGKDELSIGQSVEFCYDPCDYKHFYVPMLAGAKTVHNLKCISALFTACGFVILSTACILKLVGML